MRQVIGNNRHVPGSPRSTTRMRNTIRTIVNAGLVCCLKVLSTYEWDTKLGARGSIRMRKAWDAKNELSHLVQ